MPANPIPLLGSSLSTSRSRTRLLGFRRPELRGARAMTQADDRASPKLRAVFLVAAAIALLLWAASLLPAIENWNNPREDGFSVVPAFWGTIICLPIGLYLLAGGIRGHGQAVRRARTALIASIVLLAIGAALEIMRRASIAASDRAAAKWIDHCKTQLEKEHDAASVQTYCLCMFEYFDNDEIMSQSEMERFRPPVHRLCRGKAGWT